MLAALPGREINYDFGARSAIEFVRDENAGAVKVNTATFKVEYPHVALVYLVEAARLYPTRVGEIEALLNLALNELRGSMPA